jgi:outer membrane protein insertion porin family
MKKLAISLVVLLCVTRAYGFEPFTVKDIRLEGLQRISIGTVFNYLPIKVGEQVTEEDATNAVRVLFKTGFFKDVRLEREGNVLVVFVAERPAISEININGNDEIGTEDLKKALKDMGLEQGRVFDRVVLERIEYELKRQYYSLGKYGVKVTTDVEPLERNRIAVNINIAEGEDAEVYAINFVGNKTYSSEQLQEYFILSEAGIFGGRDSYSRQVLAGDLESLRSFYMDRGHINFNIDSTQVALTPDKQDVYLTINITEGEVYTIREVKVLGEIIIPQEKLEELILVEKGQLFSRRKVTETRKNITDALAEMGYPFSNVNVAPGVDEDSRSVELTIFVDPGRRVYVRRINITGNVKSKDEVVRR